MDRTEFFSDYARITYPAAVAPEAAKGIEALGRSEAALAQAVNQHHGDWEETSPSYWDDPLTTAHLRRAASEREQFRQTRLLAEEAEEHLLRALQLGGDGAALSDFVLQARMLDYAGMKNIYAAELADFWHRLGASQTGRRDLLSERPGQLSRSQSHCRSDGCERRPQAGLRARVARFLHSVPPPHRAWQVGCRIPILVEAETAIGRVRSLLPRRRRAPSCSSPSTPDTSAGPPRPTTCVGQEFHRFQMTDQLRVEQLFGV